MVDAGADEVTRLLETVERGDRASLDALFPLVYEELRTLARRQRRRLPGNATLNTTALVHEAYPKLVDRPRESWDGRVHFMATAARAMRQILIDYARRQVSSELWKTTALSWVSRGAWDSALVAIDRAAMAWPEPRTALGAYGLAVTGAALGLSPPAESTRRRPRTSDQPDWSPAQLAELAWLDGVLAYVREDGAGLDRARRALERSSAPHVTALRGSLAAFAVDAAGQRARAGRDLARVEWESATRFSPPPGSMLYPFLVPINRLVASGWLRETGQDAEAARLLTWFEATSTPQLAAVRVTFGWLGLIDRAEIAESLGDRDRAVTHYARFLDRHDLPASDLEPLMERARAGLERLRPR